jgi:hypothetical protein
MSSLKVSLAMLSVVVLLAACQKAPDAAADAKPADAAGAAATPATAEAPAADADPEVAARKAAVAFALAEQEIASDPKGQWATTATASSTFSDAKGEDGYSAWQATGAPNVEQFSDARQSWASKDADKGVEWLEVGFGNPVHATALRIRQSFGPGAIIQVELLDDKGARHAVFSGTDEAKYPDNTITWFKPEFEKTAYLVTGARITLATNAVSGWNEIDAVQLVGE